ncbi:GNAT family N-acetyltransferase [Brevibacillus fluminis]|uniref:GNAT family N-acetyltransferase n=1 Tax=Brevibacillus fluminis TaxID=511487 RepID=UPI003F8AE51D
MEEFAIRAIGESDLDWVREFLLEHWGSTQMVYSKGVHQCDRLPGFAAFVNGEPVGLLTYESKEGACEIVSLDSVREGIGIGTGLLQAVEQVARENGLTRLWLITTNDNLHALRFYQKRGYALVRIYRDAVEAARKQKPQIPLYGNDGIPIRDEIELEKNV